jgi:UDP-2-acetamido-3-amino-2,3-dideoxy-glucuronate N-acetyltransferase
MKCKHKKSYFSVMTHDSVFIHSTAIVEEGAEVGPGSKIWHFCHLMPHCRIGADVSIGQNVFIDNQVEIGSRVKIQNNVSLYNGVVLEDEVFVGPSVVFTNVINPRSFIERKQEFRKTLVRQGVTVGANATIVCGVEIGAYAFIGAGAVITKNIKPFALVYGNPARQHGWVSKNAYKLIFNSQGESTCPESGERYLLKNGELHVMK